MLESMTDKALTPAEEKLTMSCNDTDISHGKHLTVENNIEVFTGKKEKENFSDGMKMHNFTECCRMWMCSHCSKSFASSRALKIHEVKQHENATRHVLKCGTCHEEFEHANLLHIHMRVHHNVKVRCPRCKDIFEHPNNLKLHIKSHHSEPVCVACGLKFDHDKLLRLHMEHYHKVGDKGPKQGATKSGQQNGRKTKAVEDEKATGDAERGMKSVAKERENRGIENHEEMRQVKEDQVPKQANGSVFSEWEFGCRGGQHDDETTSHDSSDSKDEGSSDGEAGEEDPDEGSVSEPRETENHITMEDQQCTLTLSPPQLNSEGESFLSKTKGENVEGAPKEMNSGLSPSAVECLNVPVQPRRSSVIVTTGKVSPPITHSNPRENLKRKADDSGEDRQELPKVSLIVNEMAADWETSHKRSPQSPAGSYARSPASTLSGDESGDSESANHKAHTPKRVTLRCNRCQEEFLSKMEYLHHLISHQNGDDNKMPNDLSPENQAIQKLKSTLRIKMKTERRDSFADEVNHGFDIHKSASPETSGVVSSDQTLYESNRTSPPAQKDGLSSSLTLPCTLCNKRFSDSRELKTHVESRHKKPQCTECGLQFDHKNLLKIHMNSYHSSLDVLQCYHCGKSFVNRTEFVSHVTSHETTVKTAKEARKGHSALRRLSSAPMAFESHSRIHSEIKRMFPDSVGDRNGKALGGKNETKKQGDEMLAVSGSDPLKSRFDDVRNYIERRFLSVGAFRHHKEETTVSSQKPEEWHNKERENFLIGPEARTRIFLPKQHEKIEHDHEQFGGHRPVPDEGKRLSPIRNDVNRDSAVAERFSGSDAVKRRFSAFTAYERTDRSNEVAQHMLLGRAKRDRDGVPLGRPPPLIPVVHPKLSHTLTRQPDSPLLRAHQPVTRTASANSALRYPRVLPYPALSPKWPPELNQAVPSSPVRDSPRDVPRDRQEFATRESINNITKEALLNSLSLRRRASAPELGARARPLSEPQRLAVPDSATIKNLLDDSPQRSEKRESPLAASPGRSRQLNEGYQPRRRHPRDFTCHHCGIYFGHKKLLKIHLDCYHGTSQELQCLRCEKNFSSRSEFLEHLMSHEGGDELLAFQRKRLRLDRRSSLPHEGETIIRRELNVNVANETAVTRKASLKGELELADIRGEFRHPLPEELKQQGEEKALEYPKPNNVELKHERRITGVKPSTEKDEGDDGANFCFVCGQSFSSGKRLEHHISSHAVVDKDGRYCCSLCPKTFDHHRKLEIHTRSHTGFKPHKCELCGRCFPYYSSYYYHKMTHTEDRPHKCGVCGKGFIQTRYLRSHMKTHPEQNGWASDEELNSESSPEQVKTSEDASTVTKPSFSETDRKIKIEPVDEAAASVQRDLEEQDTARILCSFKQSSSVGLREQNSPCDTQAEVVTHGDVTSEETACTENSSRVDRTGEPSSPLEARESDEVEGNDHSIIVEGTVPNVQKETPQDQNVTNELLPKTKKKKYKCKHCEKNFSSYSSLHVHVRIHTGQRPYSCTHCFKKFTHSSGLKRHVRCHTGEKPYPCPACPSAFADRGALKSHIRTHTGERPFVCDLCNKTFTQPSSLRVHKKTVHAHEFFDEK